MSGKLIRNHDRDKEDEIDDGDIEGAYGDDSDEDQQMIKGN